MAAEEVQIHNVVLPQPIVQIKAVQDEKGIFLNLFIKITGSKRRIWLRDFSSL